jgi:diguanylate cyclase (GGDEF)-like protein/PAS domain S-box-containing protein
MAAAAAQKPRILIVEDEVIVVRDIEQQLLGMGYEPVGHCALAEQAIELAAQLRPDLVLMDIQLAGAMDGIAAADILRRQYELPIVFLTAFDSDAVISSAKLAEPYGYILKPFSASELNATLAVALFKHQAERRLKDLAGHLQAVLDGMFDSTVTIDAKGLITSFNKAASASFGYSSDEVLGRNVSLLMPEPHRSQHDGYLQRYLSSGVPHVIGMPRELTGQRRDGSVFPLKLSVSKVSRAGQVTFVGLLRDITEERRQLDEIQRLAFYDPLTGLPNRRLLMDRLKQALASSERSHRHGALMFLDLDHFKQLNDILGHDVGDQLLQQVATRIHACLRETDSVSRLGGDEFVMLLGSLSAEISEAEAEALQVAHKILRALDQPYSLDDNIYQGTSSIGIALFSGESESVETLLKHADQAMYQAKSAGRNSAYFYDPARPHEVQAAQRQRGLPPASAVPQSKPIPPA